MNKKRSRVKRMVYPVVGPRPGVCMPIINLQRFAGLSPCSMGREFLRKHANGSLREAAWYMLSLSCDEYRKNPLAIEFEKHACWLVYRLYAFGQINSSSGLYRSGRALTRARLRHARYPLMRELFRRLLDRLDPDVLC